MIAVLYVGEKGYWEGRVGNSTGWFHHSYVEEKKKGKYAPTDTQVNKSGGLIFLVSNELANVATY